MKACAYEAELPDSIQDDINHLIGLERVIKIPEEVAKLLKILHLGRGVAFDQDPPPLAFRLPAQRRFKEHLRLEAADSVHSYLQNTARRTDELLNDPLAAHPRARQYLAETAPATKNLGEPVYESMQGLTRACQSLLVAEKLKVVPWCHLKNSFSAGQSRTPRELSELVLARESEHVHLSRTQLQQALTEGLVRGDRTRFLKNPRKQLFGMLKAQQQQLLQEHIQGLTRASRLPTEGLDQEQTRAHPEPSDRAASTSPTLMLLPPPDAEPIITTEPLAEEDPPKESVASLSIIPLPSRLSLQNPDLVVKSGETTRAPSAVTRSISRKPTILIPTHTDSPETVLTTPITPRIESSHRPSSAPVHNRHSLIPSRTSIVPEPRSSFTKQELREMGIESLPPPCPDISRAKELKTRPNTCIPSHHSRAVKEVSPRKIIPVRNMDSLEVSSGQYYDPISPRFKILSKQEVRLWALKSSVWANPTHGSY
ncbi:uncharacterized protein BJ171DRAFT_631961 [Polychytrium aggregatum]|uniref:uncharacterized protein n=1 Tax=Polychytrium aggregatum TaxID=110093 RepID=UPI0022FEDCE8|nr:uncharacterized protein BJ171DRAFT_631961 [Polychytrium aggregatum]KAI9199418.1 hypothetical protein BJ171DRAFT_631961 [Polychytrium aggregatum]